MRYFKIAFVLSVTLIGLGFTGTAEAAIVWPSTPTTTPRTGQYIVQETIGWNKEVRKAVPFVDRYTNTTMRFGKCPKTGKCIMIRHGNVKGNPTGWSTGMHNDRCTITVQTNVPRNQRTVILAHELGHCFGAKHRGTHDNVMYPPLKYKGKVVPLRFLPSDQTTMRKF